jgi:hypothetical protein
VDVIHSKLLAVDSLTDDVVENTTILEVADLGFSVETEDSLEG